MLGTLMLGTLMLGTLMLGTTELRAGWSEHRVWTLCFRKGRNVL